MDIDPETLVDDFVQVAVLSGMSIAKEDIETEVFPAPHRRPRIYPPQKQVAFTFGFESKCLIVGISTPKNKDQFLYEHYSLWNKGHSLARLLIEERDKIDASYELCLPGKGVGFAEVALVHWIEQHTSRYHFLIDKDKPEFLLYLLVVFLHGRLKPVYELSP